MPNIATAYFEIEQNNQRYEQNIIVYDHIEGQAIDSHMFYTICFQRTWNKELNAPVYLIATIPYPPFSKKKYPKDFYRYTRHYIYQLINNPTKIEIMSRQSYDKKYA